MADRALAEPDADALLGLEDRIHKAITLVSTLRRERETLAHQLADAQAEIDRLSQEMASLREERSHVRSRIEKLLGHIDQLSL